MSLNDVLGIQYDVDLVSRVTAHVKAVGRKGRTVDEEELLYITEMYIDCNCLDNSPIRDKDTSKQRIIQTYQKEVAEVDFSVGPPMHN